MAPADPVKSLQEALDGMSWSVEEGAFALVGFPGPPAPEDLECLERPPGQLVVEAGETTLLLREAELPGVRDRHPAARCERDLAWIRFETPMGWEVVGFLAHVAAELAREGVPIGAVCGFSRDHLFLARAKLPSAREALARLFPEARGGALRGSPSG